MHSFSESNKIFNWAFLTEWQGATKQNKILHHQELLAAKDREQWVQMHKKGVLQISVCHTVYNYKGTSIVIIHLRTTLTLYLGLRLSRMGWRSGKWLFTFRILYYTNTFVVNDPCDDTHSLLIDVSQKNRFGIISSPLPRDQANYCKKILSSTRKYINIYEYLEKKNKSYVSVKCTNICYPNTHRSPPDKKTLNSELLWVAHIRKSRIYKHVNIVDLKSWTAGHKMSPALLKSSFSPYMHWRLLVSYWTPQIVSQTLSCTNISQTFQMKTNFLPSECWMWKESSVMSTCTRTSFCTVKFKHPTEATISKRRFRGGGVRFPPPV